MEPRLTQPWHGTVTECPTSGCDTELWVLLAGIPQPKQAQAKGDFSKDIKDGSDLSLGLVLQGSDS